MWAPFKGAERANEAAGLSLPFCTTGMKNEVVASVDAQQVKPLISQTPWFSVSLVSHRDPHEERGLSAFWALWIFPLDSFSWHLKGSLPFCSPAEYRWSSPRLSLMRSTCRAFLLEAPFNNTSPPSLCRPVTVDHGIYVWEGCLLLSHPRNWTENLLGSPGRHSRSTRIWNIED